MVNVLVIRTSEYRPRANIFEKNFSRLNAGTQKLKYRVNPPIEAGVSPGKVVDVAPLLVGEGLGAVASCKI